MDEQRKFLEMESIYGEDAVQIVQMTTKDLEYYIKLVEKAVERVERIDSNFERSSTVGKIRSDSIACYREIISKKSQLTQQTSLFYFQKLPQTLEPSATTIVISQQLLARRQSPSSSKKITTHCRLRYGLHFFY